MLVNTTVNPDTFRESTEDLIHTIQAAVRQNELSTNDREWLIGELDELIEGLKNAKSKQTKAKESKKAA